jgi:hypothetical protein
MGQLYPHGWLQSNAKTVLAVNKGHNNRILCGDYLAVCGEYGYYSPQEVR